MNDLQILQELDLPLYVMREKEVAALPLVVFTDEQSEAFSAEHRIQLDKIMGFLGFGAKDYLLLIGDQTCTDPINTLLCFGTTPALKANRTISTHSISAMLQNPACKREVLNAIQSLRRQA